jgi:hypothetical protein
MAYELNPRDSSIADEDPQRWTVRITLDAYPGMALETEYDNLSRAEATDAVAALDAEVTADPVKYFGPAPE